MRVRTLIAFSVLIISSIGPASAGETVQFTYDANGRLVRVDRSGSVNNGVSTTYSMDKADNRTNKTTTGAP